MEQNMNKAKEIKRVNPRDNLPTDYSRSKARFREYMNRPLPNDDGEYDDCA
jgi:hypothetical protein